MVRITATARVFDWCLTRELSEPVASTSYATRINGHDEQPYFDNDWPAIDQHAQPHNTNFLGQNVSFYNTVPEASTAIPTPSSGKSLFYFETHRIQSAYRSQTVPLDYWWSNQNQSSISTSCVVSMRACSS